MRRLLTEGTDVNVIYLATSEHGVVERIDDAGRTVTVVTDGGSVLEFHLNASAHFITRDRSARLRLT
jgi:hypothetical protein